MGKDLDGRVGLTIWLWPFLDSSISDFNYGLASSQVALLTLHLMLVTSLWDCRALVLASVWIKGV